MPLPYENATSGEERETHCAFCGDEFDEEELESPYLDENGVPICVECYDRDYMDYCTRCDEKVDKTSLSTEPGQLIAVWNDAPGSPDDLKPGYYRVKDWPFVMDGIIEARMLSSRLTRVGDLDPEGVRAAKNAQYLCGPMCSECKKKIAENMTTNNLLPPGKDE